MKKLFWRIAMFFFPFTFLFGCTSTSVLMQSCPLPAALDHVAQGPLDIPEVSLPPKDAVKMWAGDRHLLKSLADDYNALRGHVKRECK